MRIALERVQAALEHTDDDEDGDDVMIGDGGTRWRVRTGGWRCRVALLACSDPVLVRIVAMVMLSICLRGEVSSSSTDASFRFTLPICLRAHCCRQRCQAHHAAARCVRHRRACWRWLHRGS